VTFTHQVADRMYGAIVRGTRAQALPERVAVAAGSTPAGTTLLPVIADSATSSGSIDATSASACCGDGCCA
jgi:hypothetical protein